MASVVPHHRLTQSRFPNTGPLTGFEDRLGLLLGFYSFVFPVFLWVLAVWRVSRLRPATRRNPFGISPDNYQDSVTESVSDTVQEQIATALLEPLFHNNNVMLPPGKTAHDVVEIMAQTDPNNLQFLSDMYKSLSTSGASSPFFLQALDVLQNFL